ncbi:MAG TPA: hypothetical protein VMT66_09045 [Steroidobacteraceae bacterium]|nr:hypothetical protein [Steroidobacteraceae bacterium]
MTRLLPGAALGLVLTQLVSCAGGTVGVSAGYPEAYWDGPDYEYYPDYFYGPPVVYGGWAPGYYVAPPRWDGHPHDWDGHGGRYPHGDGHGPRFRPAPEGRAVPSIPSGPRGGGMRGAPARPR